MLIDIPVKLEQLGKNAHFPVLLRIRKNVMSSSMQ